MPIHSLEVWVWKRLGDQEPVLLPTAVWRADGLPSRGLFVATLELLYESIELPWFPDGAEATVETHDGMVSIRASEPVAPAQEVALELWRGVQDVRSRQTGP
ncbi:hypothetical protein EON82_26635 [bacterium]|nr:MAG: hypothetical protein EON82_26635 [bacterium]